MTSYTLVDSPLGALLLVADHGALSGLYYPDHRRGRTVAAHWHRDDAAFTAPRTQLAEYFAGDRRSFSLRVAAAGTPFQQAVWAAMAQIGFGDTATYAELATAVGRPGAARAVGAAVARNPVSIVWPCHRVVGASGRLTGYAGGTARKQRLLDLERADVTPRHAFMQAPAG